MKSGSLQFTWNAHFERLIGVDGVRELIETNASLEGLIAQAQVFCNNFSQQRQPYLMYE